MVDGGYYESGNYYFYITDHLGNNRIVTNAAASVVQSTQYYPFGSSFADASGTSTQPYKYNGKELDQLHGLNLYDYSARYMDAAIGRFTTVDPKAEEFYAWSPYVYCLNNPIKLIDPTGEIPILIPIILPIVIKFVAGATIDAAAQTAVNMAKGESFKEAVGNIDVTSVISSGAISTLTAPGTSTAARLTIGTTAVAMNATNNLSYNQGLTSVFDGTKSLSSTVSDAVISSATAIGGTAATSGINKSIQKTVDAEVKTITKLGAGGKNVINNATRDKAIKETTEIGNKIQKILTNGIDFSSGVIGTYKPEPTNKSRVYPNHVER